MRLTQEVPDCTADGAGKGSEIASSFTKQKTDAWRRCSDNYPHIFTFIFISFNCPIIKFFGFLHQVLDVNYG